MEREKAIEKLKKLKALAERGVGGERETAMKIYKELLEKYEISEAEAIEDAVTKHWFSYRTELEEELLTQIFYKVTGSNKYYVYTGQYKRRKKRGCDCTEIEAAEIKLLFSFYSQEMERELKAFKIAFWNGNDLFPDKTARCYEEPQGSRQRTDEETRMMKKAGFYTMFMDKRKPPRGLISDGKQGAKED